MPPDVPEQYKQLIDDMTVTLAHYGDMVWGVVGELGGNRFECNGKHVKVIVAAANTNEENGSSHNCKSMPCPACGGSMSPLWFCNNEECENYSLT